MMEEYGDGQPILRHVDAYRMGGPDDFEALGVVDILAPECVTVIEWPERVADALPGSALRISFEHDGEERRALDLVGEGPRAEALVAALTDALADGEGA